MTLPIHKFITLGIVAILLLVLACGSEEGQDTNQGSVAAPPTSAPTAHAPESFPFPVTEEDQDANQRGVTASPTAPPTTTAPETFPFPVVELIVGDFRYAATQGDYCWSDSRMDDTVVSICAAIPAIPSDWELDERVPVPRDVNPVVEIDFSDPTISLFANFYRDPQIGSVDLVDISAKEDRVLDLSAYAKDDIYLRISGNWPQGQAAYLFRLQPIPSGEALTGDSR